MEVYIEFTELKGDVWLRKCILLRNRCSCWTHGIERRFLVSAFLLTDGGLGWIHGIETKYLVKQVHFY